MDCLALARRTALHGVGSKVRLLNCVCGAPCFAPNLVDGMSAAGQPMLAVSWVCMLLSSVKAIDLVHKRTTRRCSGWKW